MKGCKYVTIIAHKKGDKCTSFNHCGEAVEDEAATTFRKLTEDGLAVFRKRGLGMRPGANGRNQNGPGKKSAEIQCIDAKILGMDDSWFYTWGLEDSTTINPVVTKCESEGIEVAEEFVPMILNCKVIQNVLDR